MPLIQDKPPSCSAKDAAVSYVQKSCAQCQTADRYANGVCKACSRKWNAASAKRNAEKNKERAQKWKAANVEKIRATGAAYYAANTERQKATSAAWVKANPEKVRAKHAAWRSANPEKCNAKAAAWRRENPERAKAIWSAWQKANPQAVRIKSQNRRAKKAASGKLSKGLISKLFTLQKGMCPCCKQPLGNDYHLDHRMPLALGGSNTDDNMQLLRATCNLQKHAHHPIDFMQSRGFLL